MVVGVGYQRSTTYSKICSTHKRAEPYQTLPWRALINKIVRNTARSSGRSRCAHERMSRRQRRPDTPKMCKCPPKLCVCVCVFNRINKEISFSPAMASGQFKSRSKIDHMATASPWRCWRRLHMPVEHPKRNGIDKKARAQLDRNDWFWQLQRIFLTFDGPTMLGTRLYVVQKMCLNANAILGTTKRNGSETIILVGWKFGEGLCVSVRCAKRYQKKKRIIKKLEETTDQNKECT